jgi:1-acyl-sn-glycerol-3-phosphate acyltransferase
MPDPQALAPTDVRDRHSALAVAVLVCVALPTLTILVLHVDRPVLLAQALWFAGSAAGAALLALVYWAPYRALGLVPYAALAWVAAAAHGVYWGQWPGWAHGAALGLIVGALARGHRGREPRSETIGLVVAVVLGGGVAWAVILRGRPFDLAGWGVLASSVVLLLIAWTRLFRPTFELSVEPILWLMYHIRGAGPGLHNFPRTGPCLVLANHACWLDPLFLAKVLPRPTVPMMTSRFYDLPVIAQLVKSFGVIRVPDRSLKKDAPEIQEAIAALDRGECVVIFPEGYLRRTADKPLRRFGQGVWQLLKARPNTPVFATWIEGGWGSYTSYFNGAPTKNKKKDFRRAIGVGVSASATVPPDLLEEHLRTRIHLMNLVSEARKHLGLDPLPPFALPEKADEEES